ncbi:MAG: DUF4974 domain-containing protein [Bacteroidales bacterium]|jgi:ferric-dicitrate binding protein FerR (iron transport regulator)|nr:DUF4974 domain-containing protein [Bacteroidales bacterium]
MKDNPIDLLLSRYFSGEASAKELRQLDQWLSQSAENERYFDEMTALFQLANLPLEVPESDTVGALRHFKEHAERHPKNRPTLNRRLFYGSVAAVVLVLVGIFGFYQISKPDPVIQIVTEHQNRNITIPELADVELTAGSQLFYRKDKKNEVELTGIATFVVVSSEMSEKLTVFAGETRIQDIGTIFTVSANENQPVTVEVTEGKVLFYTEHQPGITVSAGEKGVYNIVNKEFILIKKDDISSNPQEISVVVENPQETSVEENVNISEQNNITQKNLIPDLQEITFRSVPLKEVVAQLQQQFGVEIVFDDPDIGEMIISTGFMPEDNIDNVLLIISRTLSLRVVEDKGKYILRK